VPYTSTQLVNTVALDLNVIGVGEALAAEDEDLLARRCKALVADMAQRAVLYLPDLEQIADGLFEPLVAVLVMRLGPGYGRLAPNPLELEAAEDRIKSTSRPIAARRTLQIDPALLGRGCGAFNLKG
jgi:hypothetical protein